MTHISNLKKATLAELDNLEVTLRETAERQIENLESEWVIVTPEDLDKLDAEAALEAIDCAFQDTTQLAQNIAEDFIDWAKVAKARVRKLHAE